MRPVGYALALGLLLPASAQAATLVLAGPASPYEEMVHNDGAPDGTSLTLDTYQGGYFVNLFSSGDMLAASGSGNGFATVTGPFSDLTIDPLSPVAGFSAIQFTLVPDGANNISYLFNIAVNLLDGTTQNFSTDFASNNKFDILVQAEADEIIKSITFSSLMGDTSNKDRTQIPYDFLKVQQISFDPVFDDEVPHPEGGVPEPGTWAMMLLGFGSVAAAMRRRRASGTDSLGRKTANA
jgi:hypothetical protein